MNRLMLVLLMVLFLIPMQASAQFTKPTNQHTCVHAFIESITTADEFVFRLPNFYGTMTRVDCEAYSGTSFVINICDGEDIGDDTCATSILGGTLTCDASGASDTSLSATKFAPRDKISIVVTAVTGTVNGEIMVTCTDP